MRYVDAVTKDGAINLKLFVSFFVNNFEVSFQMRFKKIILFQKSYKEVNFINVAHFSKSAVSFYYSFALGKYLHKRWRIIKHQSKVKIN